MFEKGDLVIGGMVGVAKCAASRTPPIELPDITSARWEPACGARNNAPVWGEENEQPPISKIKGM